MYIHKQYNLKKGRAHIGTSGFYYKNWVGNFYPEDLKQKDWFDYYQILHWLNWERFFYLTSKDMQMRL
jgi:uncharacterized protein YecE (DUF72 family)